MNDNDSDRLDVQNNSGTVRHEVRSAQEHDSGAIAPDVLTIFDFFSLLVAEWRAIVQVTLAVTAVGIGYALFATPIYRSEAVLSPSRDRANQSSLLGQIGGLASLAGVSIGGANNQEAIAVLRSSDFTRKFIEAHNLMPRLFEKEWDKENEQWKNVSPEEWPDIRKGVDIFDRFIRRVSEVRGSGLVRVSIDWKEPVEAAEWVNGLVAMLNQDLRDRAIRDAERNIHFLQNRLSETNVVVVQQSIGRILEAELQKQMLAQGKEDFAYAIIDRGQVPFERVKPRRVLLGAISAVGGFLFGVLIVSVRAGYRRHARTF